MGDWLKQVKESPIIAVIRSSDYHIGKKMAHAVAAGGIKSIEITANSDRPWETIESLQGELPECSIGTGTILSLADVRNAIACGAEYLFTPHVDRQIIEIALAANIPIVPGALTPTEIITAWQAGATAVKVFPIQAVGGIDYLRGLQGPIGHIPLIPTGGITVGNAPAFLAAGAVAIGLSGDLFPADEIQRKDWISICNRARKLVAQLDCQKL